MKDFRAYRWLCRYLQVIINFWALPPSSQCLADTVHIVCHSQDTNCTLLLGQGDNGGNSFHPWLQCQNGVHKLKLASSKWPLYFGIISPFGIVYIFNIVMFFIISFAVLCHRNKDVRKETKIKKLIKKATTTFVLAIMFGVGWIFGILGSTGLSTFISSPSQITFVVVVGFQGLFVFLHFCRCKDAHEEWKKWFYNVTCRSKKYTEKLKLSKQPNAQSNETSPGPSSKTKQTGVSSSSSSMAIQYGYNRCRSSDISAASTIASRFGATNQRSSENSGATDTLKSRGGSITSVLQSTAQDAVMEENMIEDEGSVAYGGSSDLSITNAQQPLKKSKPHMIQMTMFDSNQKLITFDDTADSFTQQGNVVEYTGADSGLMAFSPESDTLMFANLATEHEAAVEQPLKTWQMFDYDEETQSGAATIFYNFEDDDNDDM